jgi:hypothetical protein
VTLASDDRPPILGLDGQGDAILDVAVLRRVAAHMHGTLHPDELAIFRNV